MACCACGESAELKDGKLNHARFATHCGLTFVHICRLCCTQAVMGWAVKHKIDSIEPPAPPTPTGPPTATGEAPELKAIAA